VFGEVGVAPGGEGFAVGVELEVVADAVFGGAFGAEALRPRATAMINSLRRRPETMNRHAF